MKKDTEKQIIDTILKKSFYNNMKITKEEYDKLKDIKFTHFDVYEYHNNYFISYKMKPLKIERRVLDIKEQIKKGKVKDKITYYVKIMYKLRDIDYNFWKKFDFEKYKNTYYYLSKNGRIKIHKDKLTKILYND